jgi:hypothetical protein
MLAVSLFLAPTLMAQTPASGNQGAVSPAPSPSAAEVPRLIKFSGTLLDAQDRPMAGPVGVTFALHAQQAGGAALWMETQNVTPDAHGNYTILLGANSANGVPAELFASGEARWLEVQVERQAEQPRILLVSVPYALKAKDAETLGGKPASAFLTTETLAGAGNSTGATASASTTPPSAKAQTTPKKAASVVQAATACASVGSNGAAPAGTIAMFTAPCTIQNSVLQQDASGRIGLGRPPVQTLDVNGGIRGTGLATGGRNVSPDAINTNALFLNGSNAMGVIGTSNVAFAPGALFTKTSFYSGSVERMTIDGTTGNVGIGTTAPAAKLDVAGNLNLPATTTGGTMGVISLGGTRFAHNFGPANAGNTFIGIGAGNFTMTGLLNSAFGTSALTAGTSGSQNSAFGVDVLLTNTTGFNNAAFGVNALSSNTTGHDNSAFGTSALDGLTSGNFNIAIGPSAGTNLTASESNNIYIGNAGFGGESNVIRIGDALTQTATFIAGISGVTVATGDGVGVFVGSQGQLGIHMSSRRFKDDIVDMASESDLLMKLRPVSFYYKPELDPTHTRQYGLVAEEVAKVSSELVVFDKDGVPQTVRYHFVNAMLLNEVQKQRHLVEDQRKLNEAQQITIASQQAQIQDLAARLAKLEALLALVPLGQLTR